MMEDNTIDTKEQLRLDIQEVQGKIGEIEKEETPLAAELAKSELEEKKLEAELLLAEKKKKELTKKLNARERTVKDATREIGKVLKSYNGVLEQMKEGWAQPILPNLERDLARLAKKAETMAKLAQIEDTGILLPFAEKKAPAPAAAPASAPEEAKIAPAARTKKTAGMVGRIRKAAEVKTDPEAELSGLILRSLQMQNANLDTALFADNKEDLRGHKLLSLDDQIAKRAAALGKSDAELDALVTKIEAENAEALTARAEAAPAAPTAPAQEPEEKTGLFEKLEAELPGIDPEFNKLSGGQKKIVLDGLASRMYVEIQKTARTEFKKRLENKKLWGRTWGNIAEFTIGNKLRKVDQFGNKRWSFQGEKPMQDIHGNEIERTWRNAEINIAINPLATLGKVWKNVRKNAIIANYEKEAFVKMGGQEPQTRMAKAENWFKRLYKKEAPISGAESAVRRGEFLRRNAPGITQVVSESGLAAYENGEETVVDYAGKDAMLDRISDPNRKNATARIMDDYNTAATEFAKIPYEWTTKDATDAQNEQYRTAKAAFEREQAVYLDALKALRELHGTGGPEIFAATVGEKNQALIETMQFLSANPDAVKLLENIGNQSTTWRGMTDVAAERGQFMAGGFLLRKSGIFAGMATVAAPVAAIIGAWRGASRSKEALREQNRLGREGERQKGATVFGMGDIKNHLRRLEEWIDKAKNENNEDARRQFLSELKLRADFLDTKLDLGQVNFGKEFAGPKDSDAGTSRFVRQYKMMRLLHEARALLAADEVYYGKGDLKNSTNSYELARDKQGREIPVEVNAYFDGTIKKPEDRYINSIQHDIGDILKWSGEKNQEKVANARTKKIALDAFKSAFFGSLFGFSGESIAHHYAPKFGWSEKSHGGAGDHGKESTATVEEIQKKIDDVRQQSAPAAKTGTPETAAPARHATASVETPPAKTAIDHELLKVSFAKGEGVGESIVKFRSSDAFEKLPENVQNFFHGNANDIAKQLRALVVTKDGSIENLKVGAGSEFGVEERVGKFVIFLKDANHPGQSISLGEIDKATGAFSANSKADLEYLSGKTETHAGEPAPTETHPAEKPGAHAEKPAGADAPKIPENGTAPDKDADVPIEKPHAQAARTSPTDILEKNIPGGPKDVDAKIETPHATITKAGAPKPAIEKAPAPREADPDVPSEVPHAAARSTLAEATAADATKFTPEQMTKIDAETRELYFGKLDSYFGKSSLLGFRHGVHTHEWHAIRGMPAREFLKQYREDLTPHKQKFYDEIRTLMKEDPRGGPRKDMDLDHYLQYLTGLKARKDMLAVPAK